jgi:Methyltransferase domain
MEAVDVKFDPYVHDPLRWGASMAHHSEALLGALDAVGARSVAEVGAYAGDLTEVLVHWAAQTGARVLAIDPSPRPPLVELADKHPQLQLLRQTSLEALPGIELPDVVIIDGDHNYYTVREELRVVAERASGEQLPLLLFHDVCWPHGRRDDYFAPELIPQEYRRPLIGEGMGIAPDEAGARPDGLPYPRSAAREGGSRNGVLTAVEDFVAEHAGLRLVVIPAFFGFGAIWHEDAPWATDVARVLEPWDASPLVARLEENRIHHLAQAHALRIELWKLQHRDASQQRVLRRLLESSAFSVAELLSRLRVRARIAPAQSVIAKDEIRRVLDGPQP